MRILYFAPVRHGLGKHTKELNAMARALQQRHHFTQFRNMLTRQLNGRSGELNHQVPLGDATLGYIHADPVVGQPGPGQHQVAGLKLTNPVAHKHFA